MTLREKRVGHPGRARRGESSDQPTSELEFASASLERIRAANEVGSAIAHQLNGPLTALRLYIGEIRQNSDRFWETAETRDRIQQLVDGAFRETERVCTIVEQIGDAFEQPLFPETAAALGRDVIAWWSRSGGTQSNGDASGGEAAKVNPFILLTPREREVLGHVSQGCSNKQGAVRMQIGPRTFESHRARLMRKLGARNTADLVRMALSESPVTL
jgi:DNA-binding CsgD family transcriptional regulator